MGQPAEANASGRESAPRGACYREARHAGHVALRRFRELASDCSLNQPQATLRGCGCANVAFRARRLVTASGWGC
jgi:hypothetical protein